MKKITQAWLDAAHDDLAVIDEILARQDLTNVTAFHAQQCAEKCLKALIEEQGIPVRKTHSLVQLIGLVSGVHCEFSDADTTIPNLLDQLYTDSRYPNEFGLLPDGKPSLAEAAGFNDFARDLFAQAQKILINGRHSL
jgi:HEPN domain-containing protein